MSLFHAKALGALILTTCGATAINASTVPGPVFTLDVKARLVTDSFQSAQLNNQDQPSAVMLAGLKKTRVQQSTGGPLISASIAARVRRNRRAGRRGNGNSAKKKGKRPTSPRGGRPFNGFVPVGPPNGLPPGPPGNTPPGPPGGLPPGPPGGGGPPGQQ